MLKEVTKEEASNRYQEGVILSPGMEEKKKKILLKIKIKQNNISDSDVILNLVTI